MDFSHRSSQNEIIDLRPLTPEENRSAFKRISWVNRFLGGTGVILHHLKRFSKNWNSGEVIRILDLGTGISDIPEAIIKWGNKKGFRIQIAALDLFHESLKSGRPNPGIFPVQASCFAPPFQNQTFDYVIASMFFHHLSDPEICEVLRQSSLMAKRGVIMNDLYRSFIPYIGFWLLTLFTGDPIFRNDGLISIQRGFRIQDLKDWISKTELSFLKPRCHIFSFRVALAGEK